MSGGARPWIAYVGPVAFPEGGAAARRILNNARALVAGGYDVVIVSGQPPGEAGARFDVEAGIRCVSVNERDAEHLPKILRYARYLAMGARSRQWLAAQSPAPAAVILYSGYAPYLLQLTRWSRQNRVPLVFDAVEWYSAGSVAGFLRSPYLWQTELAMRVLIPRVEGVIAISRALERYYSGRGMKVVRVPPLIDPAEFAARRPAVDDTRLRLVYAGMPGTKDLLDQVARAVIAVDPQGERLVLEVVGVDAGGLAALVGCAPDALPRCLRAHGRVAHARSIDLVRTADFTVFLRRINRVSTCGFSTKFVESLALGTPVIANHSGDLAQHLRDGETGLLVAEPRSASLEPVLRRALELSGAQLAALRQHAAEEASRAFDFRSHMTQLCDFLGRLH